MFEKHDATQKKSVIIICLSRSKMPFLDHVILSCLIKVIALFSRLFLFDFQIFFMLKIDIPQHESN